jgi:hypothetical protein
MDFAGLFIAPPCFYFGRHSIIAPNFFSPQNSYATPGKRSLTM